MYLSSPFGVRVRNILLSYPTEMMSFGSAFFSCRRRFRLSLSIEISDRQPKSRSVIAKKWPRPISQFAAKKNYLRELNIFSQNLGTFFAESRHGYLVETISTMFYLCLRNRYILRPVGLQQNHSKGFQKCIQNRLRSGKVSATVAIFIGRDPEFKLHFQNNWN